MRVGVTIPISPDNSSMSVITVVHRCIHVRVDASLLFLLYWILSDDSRISGVHLPPPFNLLSVI